MKALKFGGIAILLAAATAYAIDGVVLKYAFKKDQVQKTRFKGTIEMQGMEISLSMVNVSKVREVSEDGTVTLEDSMTDGKVVFGGQEMEIPSQAGTVIVMKPNGEIKEIKGEEINETTYRVQNLMAFVPPTEAVQVGSKWSKDVAANKDTKAPAYKCNYTILAEEKIDGTDTFKIQYKNVEAEGSEPASMEGTVWIDKANCGLVKAAVKWANVPMPGAPMPISGNFTMERIK
ncbi:MAG: hypothetical protein WCI55_10960 [Armatimonadota bacterium]